MEFPDGLATDDKLTWAIGAVIRSEAALYLRSSDLFDVVHGQITFLVEKRDGHSWLLRQSELTLSANSRLADLHKPGKSAIKFASKALQARNHLAHKVWLREPDDAIGQFRPWHDVLGAQETTPKTFADLSQVVDNLRRADIRLQCLRSLVEAKSRGQREDAFGEDYAGSASAQLDTMLIRALKGEFDLVGNTSAFTLREPTHQTSS
jgi:hypothetical protein